MGIKDVEKDNAAYNDQSPEKQYIAQPH